MKSQPLWQSWRLFSASAAEFASSDEVDEVTKVGITRLIEKGNAKPNRRWRYSPSIRTILYKFPAYRLLISEFVACGGCSKTYQDIQDLRDLGVCYDCKDEFCDDCVDSCFVCGADPCLECREKKHEENCKSAKEWSVDDVPYASDAPNPLSKVPKRKKDSD